MAYGFFSVFLGVYLSILGFSVLQAGLVFSAVMAGGAISNAVASWRGDAIGRRRMLVGMSALMVVGGALVPLTSSVALLSAIGLFAMTTSTGGDRTAFLSLDMAILSQGSDSSRHTVVFSWYNVLGLGAKALGALLVAVPSALQSWWGIGELTSVKVMFGAYCLIALGGLVLYRLLSDGVEAARSTPVSPEARPATPWRSTTARLAGLFSLDAFGGGFMARGLISFWFASRFDADLGFIAAVFFGGQLLNAVSVVLAPPVASRIGLVNTMVWTQLLANLLMVGMALAGNVWAAVALFLARELANDMDVPTRQAYSMAIVPPESRTATAGLTNLGRNLAQTVSPGMAGGVAQATFLGAPFIIGSAVKLVYNAALYLMFSGVRAPGEVSSGGSQAWGRGRVGGARSGDGPSERP